MRTQYRLHLVPQNGATLAKRTEEEFFIDLPFRVLSSDLLSLPNGSTTCADDIKTMMNRYSITFDLTFKTQSIEEYVAEQAEHDYGYEQAATLLTRGQ